MTDNALPPVELGGNEVLKAWVLYARNKRAERDQAQAEYDRAIEVIQEALGDATEARIDGVPVVTWAWSKPATQLDRKALEAEWPEIAAKFTVEKKAARPFKLLDVQ